MARFGENTGAGLGKGLFDHKHVMTAGMQQSGFIQHQPDMAFPENKVIAA